MVSARTPSRFPKFACPFSTKKDLLAETAKYLEGDAKKEITDRDCLRAGSGILQNDDLRENVRIVYRWKLESFRKRFEWVDRFPVDVTEQQISHALAPARALHDQSSDSDVRYTINVLTCLPGVGIPVASAFLMAIHPTAFTVIDRQAYKALSVKFRQYMNPDEYFSYVIFCRSRARRHAVTLRQYDQALWERGASPAED
jgi:hypothetical protein